MKMPRRTAKFALLPVLVLLASCAGTPVHLGYSGKETDRSVIDFTKGRQISINASGFQLLLFIPININNRQARAYRTLEVEAGDDYITDVKIKESWTYAFVGTVYTTTIEATAYPRSSMGN